MSDPRPQRFAWRWLLAGTALLVAGNLGVWRLLREPLRRLAEGDRALAALVLSACAPALVYFVGGVFVGRLSRGDTVREPALAALLSLITVFAVHVGSGMVNLFALLVGPPLFFGAAYLGGRVGERWQRAAQGRRRRGGPASGDQL